MPATRIPGWSPLPDDHPLKRGAMIFALGPMRYPNKDKTMPLIRETETTLQDDHPLNRKMLISVVRPPDPAELQDVDLHAETARIIAECIAEVRREGGGGATMSEDQPPQDPSGGGST